MKHIDEFTIHSFRRIRDLKLEKLGQVNLLVGENNSGKTSVLEVLSIFSDPLNWRSWYNAASTRETNTRLSQSERLIWLFPLRVLFPAISEVPGMITEGAPRTGIYVLPDNRRQGTLDSVLVDCVSVVFRDHRSGAEQFLNGLADGHKRHWRRPFGEQKALVASIVSVLRPGMANTPSIAQDKWICDETVQSVAELGSLYQFIKTLLDVPVPVS